LRRTFTVRNRKKPIRIHYSIIIPHRAVIIGTR